ncbi:MAG TPA: helix-turn-helix transcriptional regulator [Vicinamibacterales bacterium]|nr:helix-turn-helix transcriptional regulator [Vicinamibacterales bacterium]
MVTGEQAAFGTMLRREREQRTITLASVADSIKVKQSLLASLERGDASKWPGGIYGRAFLRAYAAAIGLPSEPIVTDFQRLFLSTGATVPAPDRQDAPDSPTDLRLTLAPERRWPTRVLALQGIAALLDGLVVLAAGMTFGALFGFLIWSTTAVVAVAYYSLATTLLGLSPMLWLLNAAFRCRTDLEETPVRARPSSRELLRIVATAAPRPAQVGHDFTRVVESARTASR